MDSHLVIQLARFGDIVQTGRLIRSLQASAPDGAADVHLCVDTSLVSLARLVYPDVTVHGVTAHARPDADPFADNLGPFRELASHRFRSVCNLNYSGLNLAMARLFDPAAVRGHRSENGQPVKDEWTALAFRWTRRRRSSPVNLVDMWAAHAGAMIPCADVNPAPKPGGRGLGVVLAGRESRRSLAPALLVKVAAAAAARLGARRVVLLGAAGERDLAREFLALADSRLAGITEDLCGRTDWAGLVEALAGLDLAITPDTGTMHLAARLGVPVEAFFLSSAWAWETGPYGPGHRVWQAAAECSPCVESRPCPHGVACLRPLEEPGFLRALVKDAEVAPPAGVLCLEGACDTLGGSYAVRWGDDPAAAARAGLRGVLAEWLGLEPPTAPNNAAAEMVFQDRDWALAQTGEMGYGSSP